MLVLFGSMLHVKKPIGHTRLKSLCIAVQLNVLGMRSFVVNGYPQARMYKPPSPSPQ